MSNPKIKLEIEVHSDLADQVVRQFINEYSHVFDKWEGGGDGIPFVSYDIYDENNYRRKMRKAFKLLSKFVGEPNEAN